MVLSHHALHFGRERIQDTVFDKAGTYGIDGDAAFCQRNGEIPNQRLQRSFRRALRNVRLPTAPSGSGGVCDRYNAATLTQ